MNMHQNARLTPKGREVLVRRLERGERAVDVACAMGVSVRSVYKWRKRYRDHGLVGLMDRSSRPASSPARTPGDIEAQVVQLRRERRIVDRVAPGHQRVARHSRAYSDPPRPEPLTRSGTGGACRAL